MRPFLEAGQRLGVLVEGSSFSRLEFVTSKDGALKIDGTDLAEFDVIYLRVVGRRYEDAALVVNYAREKQIPLVDGIFEKEGLVKVTLS